MNITMLALITKQRQLALEGGTPVRESILPYSRPFIEDDDVAAVTHVLRSGWLTTGPAVQAFEKAFEEFTGVTFAISVNSGTAALHVAMYAIGLKTGDEVIVPTMTFASTANAVLFLGGKPIFVDVNPDTLLIDTTKIEDAITKNTKAIIAVDYAGHPCEYDSLRELCDRYGIILIADACHAIGGTYKGRSVGSLADLNCFSFHAVKPLATGEGGMITTNNPKYSERMKHFRNHCIPSDHREREEKESWFYEMNDLGFNYRLTDIQSALGTSQLKKVPAWTLRRQNIAAKYDAAFASIDAVTPLLVNDNVSHAYHLYVLQINVERIGMDRGMVFKALRAENIGVNVHYIPVHLHPYYQKQMGIKAGLCPIAEEAYEKIISIPIFAGMKDDDSDDVIEAVKKVCGVGALS